MMHKICRLYRMKKGITLFELTGCQRKAKALSAFEHGRSTNITHLDHYLNLAKQHGELSQFTTQLIEAWEGKQ